MTALAAMLSPTTLTFSVLVLVLGSRPLRTGALFYLGALIATLGIGVVAAFVLGDAAASSDPSSPKTWVAILDIVACGSSARPGRPCAAAAARIRRGRPRWSIRSPR